MKPLAQCHLYTFIDTAHLRGRDPAETARQLCKGGSDLIQLRAKNSHPNEIRHLAAVIAPILREAGVGFVINDHYDIAEEAGADLCHLGQEDFFDADNFRMPERCTALKYGVSQALAPLENSEPHEAGANLVGNSAKPSAPLIGLSTHAPDQALRSLATKPAYIAIGPVYATGTKPGAEPVTLEYVRWAATHVTIPWFAIGGINLGNLDDVIAAGAKRICTVSAILNAPDIAEACREFRKSLGY